MSLPLPPLENLDGWIADREARVPGLKPGVQAGIVWADPGHRTKTPVSLVYLHGYTATRGEISPVVERVSATLGANAYFARLTGHGVGPEGHRDCTAAQWRDDARTAWTIGQALGDEVVVVGTSTGGTLAVLLVLEDGEVPAATVLVSPNLGPKNRSSELLALPFREWLVKRLVGTTTGFEPENDLVKRSWDYSHHSHSLIPMMDLVRRARRQDFRRWPSPVMVVYAPDDATVAERITVAKFRKVPQATLVEWKPAPGEHNHVLAGDALAPASTGPMVETVTNFIRGVRRRGTEGRGNS